MSGRHHLRSHFVNNTLKRDALIIKKDRKFGNKFLHPSVHISWFKNHLKITAKLEISPFHDDDNLNKDDLVRFKKWNPKYNDATFMTEIATLMKRGIERVWNRSVDENCSVTTQVEVRVRTGKEQPTQGWYQVFVCDNMDEKHVACVPEYDTFFSSYMIFAPEKYGDMGSVGSIAAHEFGHVLGLDDHYKESERSAWFASHGNDNKRECVIDKGWENNIMGNYEKWVDKRNIVEIIENNASKNWGFLPFEVHRQVHIF